MRNSRFFRFINCVMIFVVAFYTCAWSINPRALGKNLREQYFPAEKGYVDPLLPYIKPEAKVTQQDFIALLYKMSDSQKNSIWNAVLSQKKQSTKIPTADELVAEMHKASRHWVTVHFSDFNYHETVKWTAEKLGVHKAVCAAATTFQLEHLITEKVFEQVWDKLSVEQRKELVREVGLPEKYANMSGAVVCATITSTIAAGSIAVSTMGFAFYILMAKTVAVVAAAVLGIPVTQTITAISVLCGPVGWAIAGISAITGLTLLGRANVAKCASFIIQIHMIKIEALGKSKVDINRYLLK